MTKGGRSQARLTSQLRNSGMRVSICHRYSEFPHPLKKTSRSKERPQQSDSVQEQTGSARKIPMWSQPWRTMDSYLSSKPTYPNLPSTSTLTTFSGEDVWTLGTTKNQSEVVQEAKGLLLLLEYRLSESETTWVEALEFHRISAGCQVWCLQPIDCQQWALLLITLKLFLERTQLQESMDQWANPSIPWLYGWK